MDVDESDLPPLTDYRQMPGCCTGQQEAAGDYLLMPCSNNNGSSPCSCCSVVSDSTKQPSPLPWASLFDMTYPQATMKTFSDCGTQFSLHSNLGTPSFNLDDPVEEFLRLCSDSDAKCTSIHSRQPCNNSSFSLHNSESSADDVKGDLTPRSDAGAPAKRLQGPDSTIQYAHPTQQYLPVSASISTPRVGKRKQRAPASLNLTGSLDLGELLGSERNGLNSQLSVGVSHLKGSLGPFRKNITALLQTWGEKGAKSAKGQATWNVVLEVEKGRRISLLVTEHFNSSCPTIGSCSACTAAGWGAHPATRSDFHFVFPAAAEIDDDAPLGKGRKLCSSCGEIIPASVRVCVCCGADVARGPVPRLQSLVHSNGFGHIMRIKCKGPRPESMGMDRVFFAWDALCTLLGVKQISAGSILQDTVGDFPLIESITGRATWLAAWLAKWQYNIAPGPKGVIHREQLAKAICIVKELPLQTLISSSGSSIEPIIHKYCAMSPTKFSNFGDMAQYLLDLKSKLPSNAPALSGDARCQVSIRSDAPLALKTNYNMAPGTGSDDVCLDFPPGRWSPKRLQAAQKVIVEVLQAREGQWVSRNEVRQVARQVIGDTGLLDFTLKNLGGRHISGRFVRRAVNPRTRLLEFCLQAATPGSATSEENQNSKSEKLPPQTQQDKLLHYKTKELITFLTRRQVVKDITMIHNFLTSNYHMAKYQPLSQEQADCQLSPLVQSAISTILEKQQYVKIYWRNKQFSPLMSDWGEFGHSFDALDNDEDDLIHVFCRLSLEGGQRKLLSSSPPPELMSLPLHATVGDLKTSIARAFQEIYHAMPASFKVEHILELEADDNDPLFGFLESGATVAFEASGIVETRRTQCISRE